MLSTLLICCITPLKSLYAPLISFIPSPSPISYRPPLLSFLTPYVTLKSLNG